MRLSIAQIKPLNGNIQKNIKNHKFWIDLAVSENADLIVFPELSLSGYEPKLAGELAMAMNDVLLDDFQKISDMHSITIGLGIPAKSESGVQISMVLFQSGQGRKIYSKQQLHPDELPYFTAGNEQLILTVGDNKIAPAICYESLQEAHAEHAKKLGAQFYLASVAKSQNGIDKATLHYSKIAQKFAMPVLMSNSIGLCDNFLSAGQSAVWNEKGEILEKLGKDAEGLLIFDTQTQEIKNIRKT